MNLVFGVMPAGIAMLVSGEAQMVNSSLEQLMQAASKDGSMVLIGQFAQQGHVRADGGARDINSIKDLKGKRIAIGQIGDAPYDYLLALLAKSGLEATRRAMDFGGHGRERPRRGAHDRPRRCHAADRAGLLQGGGRRVQDAGESGRPSTISSPPPRYLMKKSVVQANPKLPEKLIQAHAEAIKRFYDDKAFAVKSFMIYDKGTQQADVERVYDLYAKPNAFERVPYVLAGAVKSVVEQQADAQIAAQMKAYDFHKVIDNSYVEHLVKEGFFEKLFGPSVKAEEERKAKLAFK